MGEGLSYPDQAVITKAKEHGRVLVDDQGCSMSLIVGILSMKV